MRTGSRRRKSDYHSQGVTKAVVAAFRPCVRVLVDYGMSIPEAESLLRSVGVHEVAEAQAVNGKRPNASRIALVTGLDRKQVGRILRNPPRVDPALKTRFHRANKVLAGWYGDRTFVYKNKPLVLPIKATDSSRPSFWMLAHRYASDVYPGLILRELSHVGALEKLPDGRVRPRMRRYRVKHLSKQYLSDMRLLKAGVAPARK
jgi:hypothetical protein